MRRVLSCLFVLGITGWVAPASAQSIGASGYVSLGSMRFAASDSFELVTGSSSRSGWGVGGTVSLWRGVFADVSFWQHKPEGERVFVDGGNTYQLGIPVRITFQPIDLIGGWRLAGKHVQP